MQQNSDRQAAANGSSYYDYQMSSNRNDARDYARNGEIVTATITSQLTTGTSTPALVAQALSGVFETDFEIEP